MRACMAYVYSMHYGMDADDIQDKTHAFLLLPIGGKGGKEDR